MVFDTDVLIYASDEDSEFHGPLPPAPRRRRGEARFRPFLLGASAMSFCGSSPIGEFFAHRGARKTRGVSLRRCWHRLVSSCCSPRSVTRRFWVRHWRSCRMYVAKAGPKSADRSVDEGAWREPGLHPRYRFSSVSVPDGRGSAAIAGRRGSDPSPPRTGLKPVATAMRAPGGWKCLRVICRTDTSPLGGGTSPRATFP